MIYESLLSSRPNPQVLDLIDGLLDNGMVLGDVCSLIAEARVELQKLSMVGCAAHLKGYPKEQIEEAIEKYRAERRHLCNNNQTQEF